MSIAKYLAKLAQGVDSSGQLSVSKIGGAVDTTPTITAIAYPGDDTATDPAGGQTITLTGTNFANGAKVIVNGVTAGVVTVVSSTQITFVAPANPVGSYILYVVNSNGSTAIAAPGIQYSTVPTFTTAAGSIGTVYETTTVNTATAATSDSTITYYLQSGTLPSGITLNSSTGTITGTSPLTAASTTYTFTIRATDGQQQDGTREFSLTINPDVITWSNPVSGGNLIAYQGVSTVIPVTASTGSGSGIAYSASGTPSGMALSGTNFTGTPTTLGTSTGTITGTTIASNRTSQITFTWTISVQGDTYWPQTTVLLSGTATSGVDTFNSDASLNNNQLTVMGDTRPSKFNPLQEGYYSLFTDTGGYYAQFNGNAGFPSGTQDFTVEFWFNKANTWNSNAGFWYFLNGTATGTLQIYYNNTDNAINVSAYGVSTILNTTVTTIALNTWHHLAVTRSGNNWTIWLNGVSRATITDSRSLTAPVSAANTGRIAESVTGHVSNLRIVRGQALYSNTFTPGSAPLTTATVGHTGSGAAASITGTVSLLTCQSNRYLDNSSNNVAIAANAQIATSPLITTYNPFGLSSAAANYGSAYFDGTGDYLTVPGNAAFSVGSGDYTIEAWIYPTVVGSNKFLFALGQNSGSLSISIGANTANKLCVFRAGIAFDFESTSNIVANVWTHIAVTKQSGTTNIWLNGQNSGTFATSYTYADASTTVTSVGTRTSSTTEYYVGNISNFRLIKGTAVYTANFTPPTTPLTAVTGTQLLTCQTWQPTSNSQFVDNSSAANLITRNGNTSQGSMNPYGSGHSIYVNGGGSNGWVTPSGVYAKTGNTSSGYVNLTGAFTFEAWVYMTAGGRNVIFGEPNGNAYSTAWGIGLFDTANAVSTGLNPGLVFLVSPVSGYGGNFAYGSGLGFPTLNKWTHVAMCRDASNNWHFYMDGVKGTTANANSLVSANVAMPANNGPSGTLSLSLAMFNWDGYISGGNSTSMAAGFNGYLNDVRLVEGTALYTGASLTVPTQPLTPVPGTIVLLGQDNKFTNFANDRGITFAPTSVVTDKLRADKFSKFNSTYGPKTPISYSNYFDGTGDYLSTPVSTTTPGWNIMAPSGSGGGSVEAWIYVTNNTAGSSIPERIICGCLDIGTAYTGWYLAISSTGQLSIKGYTTGNTAASVNSGAGVVTMNTWTHIAVSCVSGAVTFYINGVAYSGGSLSSSWLINNTATATRIGDAYPSWNSPFIGYISNLRMINNAALYTGAALTVPSAPLSTTTNTTLLTCQDSTFKDNSVNAYVLTPTGDARPAYANPFGFTTTTNLPFSPSLNVGSAYFDGTGDWLTVPHSPAIDFNGDWTFECWVNPQSGNEMGLLSKRAGTANYAPMMICVKSNFLYFIGSTTGAAWSVNSGLVNGTAPIPSGAWTHIAVVKSGTTITAFVNGKIDQTYTGISSLMTNTTAASIGAGGADGSTPLTGHISNLRFIRGQALYTQAFAVPVAPPAVNKNTLLQVDMDKAPILDATANRQFETVGDAKIASESAYNGLYYSNYFDGTGDYLSIPTNAGFTFGTGDFTVECWVYPTATGGRIMYFGTSTSPCLYMNSSNAFQYSIGNTSTGSGTFLATSSQTVPLNTWTHVAVSRSSAYTRLFINGVQSAQGSDTNNWGSSTIRIGDDSAFNLTGFISNLRVVKGVGLYTAAFTPSTIPLTAVTNTQLLTCQSNTFKDNSANGFTITKNGDTAVKSFNPFQRNTNTSMYFDGSGDYLQTFANPGHLLPGDFTIECWAYPTAFASNNMLMGSVNGASSDYFNIVATQLEFLSNGNFQAIWSYAFKTNTWYHIAITRTGTAISAFVNGTQLTLTSGSATSAGQLFNSGTGLQVGRYGYDTSPWYFSGHIEDLRITKGVNRYPTNFTPAAYKLPTK